MRVWAGAEHEAALRGVMPADVELGRWDDAEFMVPSYGAPESLEFIATAPSLRVIQTLEAGVDWLLGRVPSGVTVCNARGVRSIPVAEWVVGMLLVHGKSIFEAVESRTWNYWRAPELAGKTVLIVGHGAIGEAVAQRLRPFDAHVIGVKSADRRSLPSLLPEADVVVLLTPLTDATRGIADREFFARMRDGALFVNAGRGALVDTDALLAALPRIRAALDVTEPEPLPDDHPLWRAPGVVITPHMAGDSPESFVRGYELVASQLARHRAGEPLHNVIALPSSAAS